MSNPTPILNNINAFDATKGTTISFNIIGGTDIVRSNIVYIYDLSTNDLICTHLYISTESIHELPPNTDPSIVYASGKSSADFVNNKNYYLQIQTFTNTAGTAGGSGMSVAKTFWCLFNPALSVNAIPAAISTTSYNVGATYTTNITDATIPVTNIIQQYKFDLYTATGTLVQTSGNIIGSGEQEGTSTTYNITYNFSGLVVNNSYYVIVTTTSTEGMTVSAQSNTFAVSIETPTVGAATATNNSCDGYISVVSNLSSEYGGNVSGETVTFDTDSVNNITSLQVDIEPTQLGSGTPSPTNVRPIVGLDNVKATITNGTDTNTYSQEFDVSLSPTVTNTEPYFFKATGDVRGDRESDKIVGGTVAWNQLVKCDRGSETVSGITKTNNNDGSITLNGTATARSSMNIDNVNTDTPIGHVFLIQGYKKNDSNQGWLGLAGNQTDRGNGGLWKNTSQYTSLSIRLDFYAGDTFSNTKMIPQMLDLTALFNPTIADYIYSLEQSQAGAGVAWFRQYFPKDYYPYDPGTLRSVEGVSAHETVGFNQWDEEWELGYIITSDGQNDSSSSNIRSKNYIKVVPNTTYFARTKTSAVRDGIKMFYYDSDKNFISCDDMYQHDTIFTTPSDCHFVRFYRNAQGGTTYKNDICINLSDPTRNGEYEPYTKHSYPLDSSLTLRGVPKLVDGKLAFDGDVYLPSGEVQRRYGVVDLGTLGWIYASNFNRFLSGTLKGIIVSATSDNNDSNVGAICSSYVRAGSYIATAQSQNNKSFGIGDDGTIAVRDESYTDAATFKSAMSGVYLVYELATPTTETADGYEQYQRCDPSGTEGFVTTGIVPVGHDTTYLTRDIFGGTLDLATGVLTVDKVFVTLDGTQPIRWTDWRHFDNDTSAWLYGVDEFPIANSNDITCDKLDTVEYVDIYSGNVGIARVQASTNYSFGVRVPVGGLTTDSAINAYLAENPIEVVYPLATPQTYQLTPHQIQTLIGTNTISSNGSNITVSYNIPITNLLVKRQNTSDTSGKWLTLYSQPITQASDMDFTYIDFLNQHGKTYRYALVPLLTQQQGDVEVEIEGGYTVSDDVLSVFDGVFIANSNGSQKLKAATEYGDLETNQDVGVLTTIGGKYPFVVSNSNLNYHSGSISALIVPSDFYTNGDLDRLDIVERREAIERFLTDKTAKVLKDWNGNIWLITFVENVEVSFVDDYGMGLGTLSAKWVEIGDVNDQTDLKQTGLI